MHNLKAGKCTKSKVPERPTWFSVMFRRKNMILRNEQELKFFIKMKMRLIFDFTHMVVEEESGVWSCETSASLVLLHHHLYM